MVIVCYSLKVFSREGILLVYQPCLFVFCLIAVWKRQRIKPTPSERLSIDAFRSPPYTFLLIFLRHPHPVLKEMDPGQTISSGGIEKGSLAHAQTGNSLPIEWLRYRLTFG